MQLNTMLAIQQFMNRVTMTGAEVNTFAMCMNALQADIQNAQDRARIPALPQTADPTK
jgi:hypothetical protein